MAQMQGALDMIWVLVAAALILMMQFGFLMLEAGAVRTKNAVSVAQKNVLDFAFATIAFALVGYQIAFNGSSILGFGTQPQGNALFFLFQVMFCGTAATIISGAVAERMRIRAYLVLSVVLSALIYPVFARFAWGNAIAAQEYAWLANAGFVDFAGSTVVHATGGWFALAACIVLGARHGRFDKDSPLRIGGHNAVLSSGGALLLFVGWIGFNGGSTLAATSAVPGIVLNTVLAGAAGTAIGYGGLWFRGAMLPERAINGLIGGLVAITAGCHLVGPSGALVLGAAGGFCANKANDLLRDHLRIDDAVGAVGAHGVAGVVGTVGLALLAPADVLPAGSHLAQLKVQAIGSLANFIWSFGLGLVLISLIRNFVRLRISTEGEEVGLNVSEHGARLGTDRLRAAIEDYAASLPAERRRIEVETGDDNELVAATLNALMDRLQEEEETRASKLLTEQGAADDQPLIALGEVSSDAIILIHNGRIENANPAASELFGSDQSMLYAKAPAALFHPDHSETVARCIAQPDGRAHRARIINAAGGDVPVEYRLRQMALRGLSITVMRITDLSERERAQKRIYHLALHDTLTDLPNRELFNRRLEQALDRRKEHDLVALLLIDVDRFKDVNDLHGHPAGDMLLINLADRLRKCVRGSDTVARLGGDEFAIVYGRITLENQALDLAHRILHAVAQPLILPSGQTIKPQVSIGIAMSPGDAIDAEAMIQNADLALYASKKRGRHRYSQYRPQMGHILRLRQELEQALAHAVSGEELELHYQPRITMATGELAGYEALVRWRRNGGLISPDDFISIAEEGGLIVAIGEWVIFEACRAAAEELGGAAISINISPRQFQDPGLVSAIDTALKESGLPHSRLEIEITESVLIEDDERAQQVITALRGMGVRVALDDFGTGYSSLSYLNRFTFDTIKIDRSFVQSDDEKTWNIVQSIMQMSRSLGTSVVAEGVETLEQLERLAAEGCDEAQGFLISPPGSAQEMRDYAKKSVPAVLNLKARVAALAGSVPASEEEIPTPSQARIATGQ